MRSNGALSQRRRQQGHSLSQNSPCQPARSLSHNGNKHVTSNSDQMGRASSSPFYHNGENFSSNFPKKWAILPLAAYIYRFFCNEKIVKLGFWLMNWKKMIVSLVLNFNSKRSWESINNYNLANSIYCVECTLNYFWGIRLAGFTFAFSWGWLVHVTFSLKRLWFEVQCVSVMTLLELWLLSLC